MPRVRPSLEWILNRMRGEPLATIGAVALYAVHRLEGEAGAEPPPDTVSALAVDALARLKLTARLDQLVEHQLAVRTAKAKAGAASKAARVTPVTQGNTCYPAGVQVLPSEAPRVTPVTPSGTNGGAGVTLAGKEGVGGGRVSVNSSGEKGEHLPEESSSSSTRTPAPVRDTRSSSDKGSSSKLKWPEWATAADHQAWEQFKTWSRGLGFPSYKTLESEQIQLNKYFKVISSSADWIRCLDYAIDRKWRGLFPQSTPGFGKPAGHGSTSNTSTDASRQDHPDHL